MPRKLDPFWEFGDPDGGFDRLHLTCKLCGQHMAGGVYRLKYHLAQIPGHEVGPCTNYNPEIIRRAMNSLGEIETTKLSKAALKSQISGFGVDRESGSGSSASASSTGSPAVASSFFVPRTTPGA